MPLPPAQIDAEGGVIVTEGGVTTVTVTVVFPLQPPVLPVTVYVVVDAGLANGDVTLVALSPVAGDQV